MDTTATILPLSDFRAWANYGAGPDAKDGPLSLALAAAERHAASYTGVAIEAATITPDYRAAVYMLAGHIAENREAAAPIDLKLVPWGCQTILEQIRGVVL